MSIEKIITPEYMLKMGFDRELTVYMIHVDPNTHLITCEEYDFYADEMQCGGCNGRNDGIWLKIEHGTPTRSCIVCRTTGLLGFGKKRPVKRYQVTPAQAYRILRMEMNMSAQDVATIHKDVVALIRVQRQRPTEKPRARPKKKRTNQ